MKISLPIIVGLFSGLIGLILGRITRTWLRRWLKPLLTRPCEHRWRIMIEKYPSFTQDRWKCDECKECRNFQHDRPPTKTTVEICSMGHAHTVEAPEWNEWPSEIKWP